MARSQLPCPLFLLCSLLLLPSGLLQEVGIPGGLTPVPVTDEGVKEAAAFAVEKYNQDSGNANCYKLLKIVEAKSQVVSGIIYYLTVELGETVCEKSDGSIICNEIQNCELAPQYKKLTCNFQIWSRPWLKENQLVGSRCF